jgi:hypothetical protein
MILTLLILLALVILALVFWPITAILLVAFVLLKGVVDDEKICYDNPTEYEERICHEI